MKRSVFSKSLLVIAAIMALVSCQKHPEIDFAGKVIDVRQCTSAFMDNNIGYVVQLDYPDSIGGTIETDAGSASGIIVLYEPNRLIYVDDHIRGSFYLDDKYSRANCSLHYTDFDLPEGVFTKVSVD
jgi:hypothetical protein